MAIFITILVTLKIIWVAVAFQLTRQDNRDMNIAIKYLDNLKWPLKLFSK